MPNYPRPHDADSTRRFVAFANYYRKFIPNFATIANSIPNVNVNSGKTKTVHKDNIRKCLA